MRETKRRVENFLFYDAAGVERHLAKMAERGWGLEKITPFFWYYRRMEPKKRTYTVTYFPDASDFDPAPTDGQQTFRAYCQASGWEFVVQWAQMQIFCTEREHPVPIETEESVRLQTTHHAMKKNYLPGSIAMAALALFQIGTQISLGNYDLVGKLADGTQPYILLLFLLLLLNSILMLGGYASWYRKSKRRVEQGGACAECGGWYRKWANALYLPVGLLAIGWLWEVSRQGNLRMLWPVLVLFVLLFLGVYTVRWGLKKARVSRNLNRGLTMAACVVLTLGMMAGLMLVALQGIRHNWFEAEPVEQYETINGGQSMLWDIYHDPLPLRVEDLAEVDYPHYTYQWEEESSFLVSRSAGDQHAFPDGEDVPDLSYEIVDVKAGFLYDLCLRQYMEKDRDWEPELHFPAVDAALWQADAVYQEYVGTEPRNRFVVCWGRRIVEIVFPYDWALTPAQIAIAAEKLRG
ncbi:MAG: DUF2812 domain-containing protein [Oscillibacter sp.]